MTNVKLYGAYNEFVTPVHVESMKFSGGEQHVSIRFHNKENLTRAFIVANIKSADDIMLVSMLKSAIDNNYGVPVLLYIPYLPYSRSDRVCANGEEFGLEMFSKLLNSMEFETVFTLDAHSIVAKKLIKNLDVISQVEIIGELHSQEHEFKNYDYVVAPDEGSRKKASHLAIYLNVPIIYGSKVRDPSNGKLTGFSVDSDGFDLKNKSVLIPDDICDGGGTFIGLGNVLKEKGVNSIDLLVSHGIYSKGTEVLEENGINLITLNSLNESVKDFSDEITNYVLREF